MSKIIERWKSFFRNNFLVIFIIVLIIVLLLVAWFSKRQFPNVLKVDNTTVVIAVLTTIASVLAAILGILIAILMVAFELFRKTYVSYASKEFFQSSALKPLFTLFISTIIISIISIADTKYSISVSNLNLFYLSLFLFIFCMIILYPFSKTILTSANSKKRINDIVDKINERNINSLSLEAFRRSPSAYISEVGKNPILMLSEAAIQTIKDNDILISKFIIFESTNKLMDLLKRNKDDTSNIAVNNKCIIVSKFLIIFRHSAEQAIKQRDTATLLTILESIRAIHIFFADNKAPCNEFRELDDALQEILKQAIKEDILEVAKYGFWTIAEILERHLEKNVPKEKDIWSLHPWNEVKNTKIDYNKSIHWDYISEHYNSILNELLKKSVELRKTELITQGLLTLEGIASYVVKSNLGNLQKKHIVWICYSYIKSIVIDSVNQGIYDSNSIGLTLSFNPFSVSGALDKKAEFSKIPLIYFSDTLVQLAQKNVLNSMLLNCLGTVGRESVEKIEDNLHAEALLFICNTFDQMRKILEKNDKEMGNRSAYIEIFNQVSSLKRWMESENKHNNIVEKKISTVLKRFKNINDYKKELENQTVKWPALKHKRNQNIIHGKDK